MACPSLADLPLQGAAGAVICQRRSKADLPVAPDHGEGAVARPQACRSLPLVRGRLLLQSPK
jgi:hypothetical protein